MDTMMSTSDSDDSDSDFGYGTLNLGYIGKRGEYYTPFDKCRGSFLSRGQDAERGRGHGHGAVHTVVAQDLQRSGDRWDVLVDNFAAVHEALVKGWPGPTSKNACAPR